MGSVQKGGWGWLGLIVVAVGMNFRTLDLLKDYFHFFPQTINEFNPYTLLCMHRAYPCCMYFQEDIVHSIMLFMLYHI